MCSLILEGNSAKRLPPRITTSYFLCTTVQENRETKPVPDVSDQSRLPNKKHGEDAPEHLSHMKKTRQRNHILFTHFQLMQFVSLLPIMKFNTCTWNLRLSTRQKGCSNWMMNQIVILLKLMGCYQQNVFFRDSSYVAVQKTMKNNKQHMGVSKNRDTPKWMVKIMENPTKMGWFGGKTHHFRKTPIYSQLVGHWPTLSRP